MLDKPRNAPHVVVVGVDLDPTRETPSELIKGWDDFGHLEAAAAGDGRLTADELDERLERALTARTYDDLAVLLVREGRRFARLRGGDRRHAPPHDAQVPVPVPGQVDHDRP